MSYVTTEVFSVYKILFYSIILTEEKKKSLLQFRFNMLLLSYCRFIMIDDHLILFENIVALFGVKDNIVGIAIEDGFVGTEMLTDGSQTIDHGDSKLHSSDFRQGDNVFQMSHHTQLVYDLSLEKHGAGSYDLPQSDIFDDNDEIFVGMFFEIKKSLHETVTIDFPHSGKMSKYVEDTLVKIRRTKWSHDKGWWNAVADGFADEIDGKQRIHDVRR